MQVRDICRFFWQVTVLGLNQGFTGIVSRDFGGLQMILMNSLCVPDVPLEVYCFLNLHLHVVF